MSRHTKKYTLASRTIQRLNQNLQESIFFSSPKRNLKIFSPTLRCFNFFRQRTVLTWTDIASNVNRFVESVCGHEQNRFVGTAAHAGNNQGFVACGARTMKPMLHSLSRLWSGEPSVVFDGDGGLIVITLWGLRFTRPTDIVTIDTDLFCR